MNKIGLERISKIDQHLSMADAMLRAMCGDPATYKLHKVAEIKIRQARDHTANAIGRVAETYSFFHGDPIEALERD